MRDYLRLRTGEKTAVLVAAAVFVLLALDVINGGLVADLDEHVRNAVQPRPPATPLWMAFPGGMGELWVAAPLILIGAIAAAQLTWRLWPLVLAIGTFAFTELLILVLKVLVGREGPGMQADRTGYPGYFPSGHTATAAICSAVLVFLLLTARRPRQQIERGSRIAIAVGLVVGAVAAWRAVLADFHWLADGAGGLLVATLVLVVSFAVCRNHVSRSEPAADVPP